MLFLPFKLLAFFIVGTMAIAAFAVTGGHCRRDIDRYRDHAYSGIRHTSDDWRRELRQAREDLRRNAEEAREEFRRSRERAREDFRRSRDEARDELHRAASELRRSLRESW